MIMRSSSLTAGQQIIQSALWQQAAHPTGHIGGGGHIIVGSWFLNAERAQQRIADRTGRQFKLIWRRIFIQTFYQVTFIKCRAG